MKPITYLVMGCAAFLSACQTVNQNEIWLRTDGRSQLGNPQFAHQFEIDRTVCLGEAQKSAVGAPIVYSNGSIPSAVSAGIVSTQQGNAVKDVLKGCMAQKGYMLVPKDQAAAIAARYRSNSAQK